MRFDQRRTLILILVSLAVTLIFTKLSYGYLPSYDDGYYSEKAREMLKSGDLLTPRVAGQPRYDNPPGFMWLLAGAFKMFGADEFAARFPSALAGVIGILGTFFLFELLVSTRIGFLAGLILTFTTVYLKYARHAMMDVTVAAAGTWASYFFVRGLRGSPWFFLLAGAVGSYVPIAKSLFGAAPLAVFFFYLLATRQMRALRRWQLWAGLLIYVVPYALWVLYETAALGRAFLVDHFYDLMFSMVTTPGKDDHHYDYVLVLLKYFPHFLPFLFWGAWIVVKERGERFALVGFLTWFIALSAQGTTKTWYFIPAFPACAGLAAVGLDRALRRFTLEQIGRATAILSFALYLVVQMTPITLSIERALDVHRLAPYVRAAAEQGFTLRSLDQDYFGLNSSLLFYSDHDAPRINEAGLRKELEDATTKLAVLFEAGDWERLRESFPRLTPVRLSDHLVLVSSAPLAQERIF